MDYFGITSELGHHLVVANTFYHSDSSFLSVLGYWANLGPRRGCWGHWVHTTLHMACHSLPVFPAVGCLQTHTPYSTALDWCSLPEGNVFRACTLHTTKGFLEFCKHVNRPTLRFSAGPCLVLLQDTPLLAALFWWRWTFLLLYLMFVEVNLFLCPICCWKLDSLKSEPFLGLRVSYKKDVLG